MRTAQNPYGGLTMMVDRLVGDAYPVVKSVYDNMELVQVVGKALSQTTIGAPIITLRGITADGATGTLGSTVVIDFPDLDIVPRNILDSRVRLEGSDGAFYFDNGEYFSTKIKANGLNLTLKPTAPVVLSQSIVQWFIVYNPPKA